MPTVTDLQNQIRTAVGRFERETSTQFTKEELAAIANEVGYEVDAGAPPSKSQMRAGIRWKVELSETEEDADETPFRKSELSKIADTLDEASS